MTSTSGIIGSSEGRERVIAEMRRALSEREDIFVFLNALTRERISWGFVGGAPRQWFTGHPAKPGDLDVVVGATPAILASRISKWSRSYSKEYLDIGRTAFGGYRVQTPTGTVDVWSAQRTIGLITGRVTDTNTYRAVAKSAALTIDSIVVTCRETVYEYRFLRTLRTGVLGMNHCRVERRSELAEKALRLCERFSLIPDLSVQSLISAELGTEVLRGLPRSRTDGPPRGGI